jgi:uncharacterized membrane protein
MCVGFGCATQASVKRYFQFGGARRTASELDQSQKRSIVYTFNPGYCPSVFGETPATTARKNNSKAAEFSLMINAANTGQSPLPLTLCWALTILWIPVSLYSVIPDHGTSAATYAGATQGLLLLVITVIHGVLSYGWKGFTAYAGIVGIAVFLLEACSIATGFPFGSYHHQGTPGPAPLGVPASVMVGCIAISWFAWMLARLVTRQIPWKIKGIELFATPIVAAFIYAGFDYPIDSIDSTVRKMWVYHHPGGQFGVPLTNYLGWIFTGWVSFLLFALLEARFPAGAIITQRRFWLLPAIVWLAIALQYPIMFAHAPEGTIDLDASRFVISHIFEASVVASIFSMIFVVLLALVKLATLDKSVAR